MNLAVQLLVGGLMIGLTVVIHAILLDLIMKKAGFIESVTRRITKKMWQPLMAAIVVVSVFTVHMLHIWIWAGLYMILNCEALNSLANALYFSSVTFTTLGYGDIMLEPGFRMLSGAEAANGFILFGWTTAFIFEVISQLYKREAKLL